MGLAHRPRTSHAAPSRASPPPPSRTSPPSNWCPSRSQGPSWQQPERQPAHAARPPHRAEGDVSPPRSAAALPAAWGGRGRGGEGGDGTCRAGTPPPHTPFSPPPLPLHPFPLSPIHHPLWCPLSCAGTFMVTPSVAQSRKSCPHRTSVTSARQAHTSARFPTRARVAPAVSRATTAPPLTSPSTAHAP